MLPALEAGHHLLSNLRVEAADWSTGTFGKLSTVIGQQSTDVQQYKCATQQKLHSITTVGYIKNKMSCIIKVQDILFIFL